MAALGAIGIESVGAAWLVTRDCSLGGGIRILLR